MPNPTQLPYQTNTDEINGGNQRATQNAFSSMPRFVTAKQEGAYVEPFLLNVGSEEPESIALVRIVNLFQPDVPVLCGELVHWIYLPAAGGASITSIDGLTSDPASRYRMTFRITYKAQN